MQSAVRYCVWPSYLTCLQTEMNICVDFSWVDTDAKRLFPNFGIERKQIQMELTG